MDRARSRHHRHHVIVIMVSLPRPTVLTNRFATLQEMESSQELSSPPSLRILQLPREIRDLIYEHVLVKDIIPIECAVSKASSNRACGMSYLDLALEIDVLYLLRSPWVYRRVWSVPLFDVAPDYFHHDYKPPSAVHMTYQIKKERAGCIMEDVDVSLFQVCKQIYAEASEIFYSKNVFSFTSDFRIPTAFAFLCDRPAASLRHIKSLELLLMEGSNVRGTAGASYPVILRSTDSLVLQYAYQYFTELCTLLSTPRINLRSLYLTVETMYSYSDSGQVSIRDSLATERQRTNCPRPWVPIWLDPLLKIEGLESLEMRWISNRRQIQRMVDTMDSIQQHMVAGKSRKNTSHMLCEFTAGSDSLKFRLQYDDIPDTLVSPDGNLNWNEVVSDNEPPNAEIDPREKVEAYKLFTTRPHCREMLDDYDDAYASFFELKGAY